MNESRRRFLVSSTTSALLTSATGITAASWFRSTADSQGLSSGATGLATGFQQGTQQVPTYGTIPVVGDGKWIWTKPPEKQTGYLEPRSFEVTTEIKSTGQGPATNLIAATVLPSEFPEQKIIGDRKGKTESNASGYAIQSLANGARQLVMSVGRVADGQVNFVRTKFRFQISKSYQGYKRDQFPPKQPKKNKSIRAFLGSSPGIKVRSAAVSAVVKELKSDSHPWDLAKSYQEWVFENIKGRPQNYTSVDAAIKNKVGDCEERAAVFIALCRASGIPARLVWIPSHCWAEILLFDTEDNPHWIPVHTAAYSWFGWTGVHELVLQKGDSIPIPQKRKSVRLVYDHYQCRGRKPKLEFTATIQPVAEKESADAGPGYREKLADGKWKLIAKHEADKFHRKD